MAQRRRRGAFSVVRPYGHCPRVPRRLHARRTPPWRILDSSYPSPLHSTPLGLYSHNSQLPLPFLSSSPQLPNQTLAPSAFLYHLIEPGQAPSLLLSTTPQLATPIATVCSASASGDLFMLATGGLSGPKFMLMPERSRLPRGVHAQAMVVFPPTAVPAAVVLCTWWPEWQALMRQDRGTQPSKRCLRRHLVYLQLFGLEGWGFISRTFLVRVSQFLLHLLSLLGCCWFLAFGSVSPLPSSSSSSLVILFLAATASSSTIFLASVATRASTFSP